MSEPREAPYVSDSPIVKEGNAVDWSATVPVAFPKLGLQVRTLALQSLVFTPDGVS